MKRTHAIMRVKVIFIITIAAYALILTPGLVLAGNPQAQPVPVTVKNFQRAESDRYFNRIVKLGGFGKFYHYRVPPAIDQQTVIRMNRDTLYSGAVFDLDAGPVNITLPDNQQRFMSIQIISEDHYTSRVEYAPGSLTLTKESVGTRYAIAVVRTLINADDPADIHLANVLQDQVRVVQTSPGKFKTPHWDVTSQDKIRNLLAELQGMSGITTERRMGKKGEVDPISHLLATATGWGLNPPEEAIYKTIYPKGNDGKTAYTLTLKDVPVDGFWSITMYDASGYIFENEQKAYALNNFNAKAQADGSITIQLGGDPKNATNYLAITPGWNFSFRLYRPHQEVIDGSWALPELQPIK